MKMKQKLAATLAGVMAVSMVPATSAFAASRVEKMTVSLAPVVAQKGEIKQSVTVKTTEKLKAGNTLVFTIEGDGSVASGTFQKKATVEKVTKKSGGTGNLYIAEWYENGSIYKDAKETIEKKDEEGNVVEVENSLIQEFNDFDKSSYLEKTYGTAQAVYSISGNTMQVKITETGANAKVDRDSDGNFIYTIPYNIKANDNAGDITVAVTSNNISVSGSFKAGSVVKSGLTATTEGTRNLIEAKKGDYIPIKNINLTEAMSGVVGKPDKATFKESWETVNNDSDSIKGYLKWFTVSVDNYDYRWLNDEEVAEDDYSWVDMSDEWGKFVKGTLGLDGKIDTSKTQVYVGNNGHDLYVGVALKEKSNAFGAIQLVGSTDDEVKLAAKGDDTFTGLRLYKAEDADYNGDVTVTVTAGRPNGSCENHFEQGEKTTGKNAKQNWEYEYGHDTDFSLDTHKIKVETAQLKVGVDNERIMDATAKTTKLTAGSLKNINFESKDMQAGAITIKEKAVGAIISDIEIEVPEGVKIIGYNFTAIDGLDTTSDDGVKLYNNKKHLSDGDKKIVNKNKAYWLPGNNNVTTFEKGVTKLVISTDEDRTKVVNTTITLLLSVSSEYEGDKIDATITAKYGDGETYEENRTIANVTKPVSVAAENTVLDNNSKKQPIEDVVITENVAGALASGEIKLTLEEGMTFVKGSQKMEIEVEEGDIKVEDIDIDGNVLTAKVKKTSTKASTVRFTGLYVTTKNLADGVYDIRVAGTAVAPNDIYSATTSQLLKLSKVNDKYSGDKTKFEKDIEEGEFVIDDSNADKYADNSLHFFNANGFTLSSLVVGDVDTTTTTKPSVKTEKAIVTIADGSTKYTRADGTTGTMVAPTYRPVDGITMVSVRAIPEMLGAEVDYAPESKTVTITMPDGKYAQVTLDSVVGIDINGRTVMMNYKAEIPEGKDGGIYVPLRYFGRLLGLADEDIIYDNATKSVVISYDKVVE